MHHKLNIPMEFSEAGVRSFVDALVNTGHFLKLSEEGEQDTFKVRFKHKAFGQEWLIAKSKDYIIVTAVTGQGSGLSLAYRGGVYGIALYTENQFFITSTYGGSRFFGNAKLGGTAYTFLNNRISIENSSNSAELKEYSVMGGSYDMAMENGKAIMMDFFPYDPGMSVLRDLPIPGLKQIVGDKGMSDGREFVVNGDVYFRLAKELYAKMLG